MRAGEPTSFTVIARDANGNGALRGGDRFSASLSYIGSGGMGGGMNGEMSGGIRGGRAGEAHGSDAPAGADAPVPLVDHGDGTHSGTLVCCRLGRHALRVSLDGSPAGWKWRQTSVRTPFLRPSRAAPSSAVGWVESGA